MKYLYARSTPIIDQTCTTDVQVENRRRAVKRACAVELGGGFGGTLGGPVRHVRMDAAQACLTIAIHAEPVIEPRMTGIQKLDGIQHPRQPTPL